MHTIAILGCGWLGLPLGRFFIKQGHQVRGTTTTDDKISQLKLAGIAPFRISLDADGISGDINQFLLNADILIISVPPKAKSATSFLDRLNHLIPHIDNSQVSKVLFVSSTSVYGDTEPLVNELSPVSAQNNSANNLINSEKLLMQNPNFKTTVIRFGGLIGPDRHPIKYLSGKPLENSQAPINLIHLQDCIGIISEIIRQQKWAELFNGVAPYHPSRIAYYSQEANRRKLPPPVAADKSSKGKVVSSDKVKTVLGYRFIYPEL